MANPASKAVNMGMFVEFKRRLPNDISPAYGLALSEEQLKSRQPEKTYM
jgi:hypothetical protein